MSPPSFAFPFISALPFFPNLFPRLFRETNGGFGGFCPMGLRSKVRIVMVDGDKTLKTSREKEDVVIIEGKDEDGNQALPSCLIGKVAIGKPFNAFGFLEVMKRAMNPSKGFIATEIGPNLFSFQF
ncbi:hypothetical protein ACS0TY_006803 [Phlomoides rotata]